MIGEPLDNPQHEKFAQLVASGVDVSVAYGKVYPKAARISVGSAGCRLFKIVHPRIKLLQAASATSTVMNMQERREFLARAKRAFIHKLDFEKDGDLIQEITRTEGSKGEAGIEKFKLPGKLECVMADAKLAGELTDTVNVNLRQPLTPEQILAAVQRSPALAALGRS